MLVSWFRLEFFFASSKFPSKQSAQLLKTPSNHVGRSSPGVGVLEPPHDLQCGSDVTISSNGDSRWDLGPTS